MTLYNGAETLVLTAEDQRVLQGSCFRRNVVPRSTGSGAPGPTFCVRGKTPYAVDLKWVDSEDKDVGQRHLGPDRVSGAWPLVQRILGSETLYCSGPAAGRIKGTIETATGDFRYLHGTEKDHILSLQTFDGAHLFHFRAKRASNDSLVEGLFSSGKPLQHPIYSTPQNGF